MRRVLILSGVWAIGVLVAVGVAFAAVDHVASGVAPHDVARLSQGQINDALASRTTSPSDATPSTLTTPTSTGSSTPTTTRATTPTTNHAPTSSTTRTTWTTATDSANQATNPNTEPMITSPTTSSTPPPATVTTAPTPTTVAQTNTVTTSQGGTLFTRCSGSETIVYVAAVPKTGYARTVDIEKPTGITQTFVNAHHRSTIAAECSDGRVHAEVEEEAIDE